MQRRKPSRVRPAPSRAPNSDSIAVLDGLRRVVRALRVSARTAEKTVGLSSARLFVLQVLAAAPSASMREIAARTMTDPSSVSTVVAALVTDGLVRRTTPSHDARQSLVSLTAAGRRITAKAPEPAQSRLVSALSQLSGKECRALATLLAKLVSGMGAADERATMFFEDAPADDGKRTKTSASRAPAS